VTTSGNGTVDAPDSRPWDRSELPSGDAKKAAVREMFDTIAPRYDLVNRIMTFRLDTRWRRRTVRDLDLRAGSMVLDLASGTGDLCIDLARSGLRPVSVDLSFGMLAADRSGAPRIQSDILRLPVADHSVDGVTCGFALRNLTDLDAFSDRGAYRYLPRSVAYLPSPDAMVRSLHRAGFTDATHRELSGGLTQLLTGTRS
jgi:demethylmenaquinone methyltransferase/2-methoxy-6-polyprenyl-1,4-benzoquinol methylase